MQFFKKMALLEHCSLEAYNTNGGWISEGGVQQQLYFGGKLCRSSAIFGTMILSKQLIFLNSCCRAVQCFKKWLCWSAPPMWGLTTPAEGRLQGVRQ